MPISIDSKKTIKQEIDRLEGQKAVVVARIKSLGDKRDSLIARRDALTSEIKNLKADIV